jgi:hypothetical protein
MVDPRLRLSSRGHGGVKVHLESNGRELTQVPTVVEPDTLCSLDRRTGLDRLSHQLTRLVPMANLVVVDETGR